MSNNSINVLDLPDELLCMIRSRMKMVDVNRRFERIALDPLCIDHVDLTMDHTTTDLSSHANDRLLERISSNSSSS